MAKNYRYTIERFPSFAKDARIWSDSFRKSASAAENHVLSLGTPLANSCLFCGDTVSGDPKDHIYASSRGGLTVPGNMMRTCTRCNFSRSNVSALEFWTKSDPAKRWYQDEKLFREALARLTAPFREGYPDHYARAVAIEGGSQEALEELYSVVALHHAASPRFDLVDDRAAIAASISHFYLVTEQAKTSVDSASAYERFAVRRDKFAKTVLKVADASNGTEKSKQSHRSNVASAALKIERQIDMTQKKRIQKQALQALFENANSSSTVRPYKLVLQALGSKFRHLAEFAEATEKEISRSVNAEKTRIRQEAKATVQNLYSGRLKKINARDCEMIDLAIGHPKTGRLTDFDRLVVDIREGKIELPKGYVPNTRAQEVLDRGY